MYKWYTVLVDFIFSNLKGLRCDRILRGELGCQSNFLMEGHLTTGYFLVYRLLAMLLDSWHQQQREISINISLKNKKPWKVYVQMLFYQMWNLEVNFYCILYCLILFIIIFALLCSTWWFCGIEILKISDISVSVSFWWNVQYWQGY